jgi:AAA15 family ATPase/GTPase
MKVRSLTVTNFRGFEGTRRFPPDNDMRVLGERFVVIAGINGRGKSSLLDGLALLLGRLLRELTLSKASGQPFSKRDVYAGKDYTELEMQVFCAGIPVKYSVAFGWALFVSASSGGTC